MFNLDLAKNKRMPACIPLPLMRQDSNRKMKFIKTINNIFLRTNIIWLLLGLVACGKKTEISGYVHSKYGHPMNDVMVITECFESNGGKRRYYINRHTDATGKYFYESNMKKVNYFTQVVASDSGSFLLTTTNINDLKNHNITVQK
jgi:hypothetical protein